MGRVLRIMVFILLNFYFVIFDDTIHIMHLIFHLTYL